MIKKKAQLVEDIIRLNQSNEFYEKSDKDKRIEFAKAFDWFKNYNTYGGQEAVPKEPTWPEIYVQIGKLLAAKTFLHYEKDVVQIKNAVAGIEHHLREGNNGKRLV